MNVTARESGDTTETQSESSSVMIFQTDNGCLKGSRPPFEVEHSLRNSTVCDDDDDDDDELWFDRRQRRLSVGIDEADLDAELDLQTFSHAAPLSVARRVEPTFADDEPRPFDVGVTDLRTAAQQSRRAHLQGADPLLPEELIDSCGPGDILPLAFAGGFLQATKRSDSGPPTQTRSSDDQKRDSFLVNPPLSMDTWDGISNLLYSVKQPASGHKFTSTGSDFDESATHSSMKASGSVNSSNGLRQQLSTEIAAIKAGGSEMARERKLFVPKGEPLRVCLEKWSPTLGRGWQWRCFELREEEETLVYWAEEPLDSSEPPRGCIELATVSRIYPDTGTSIILQVPGRHYALRFVDPQQKDVWLDILDVAIYNAKMTLRQQSAGNNEASPTTSTNGAIHIGDTSAPLSSSGKGGGKRISNTLPAWSSFIEDWVFRPLKFNAKGERHAFSVAELAMKKSLLHEKGLLDALRKIVNQHPDQGRIIDVRRYVPDVPDEDTGALSQLAERCALSSDSQATASTAKYWASILNIASADLIPDGIPPRYKLAVSQLQLMKGEPSHPEEFLNNVLAGCICFGRQEEGLSDIEMSRYFAVMICPRPVANGKAQHCRNDNLTCESIKVGQRVYKVGVIYLFECQFDNSPPVAEVDVKVCWEIKRVRDSSGDFAWSIKEPPCGRTCRFACATYRDAVSWRMAQVMVRLSTHSDKERSIFLRSVYTQKEQYPWRPRGKGKMVPIEPHSMPSGVEGIATRIDGGNRSTGEVLHFKKKHVEPSKPNPPAPPRIIDASGVESEPKTGSRSQHWPSLCLMAIPGTTLIRRRSTDSGQNSMTRLERHFRKDGSSSQQGSCLTRSCGRSGQGVHEQASVKTVTPQICREDDAVIRRSASCDSCVA